jgi:hypothetical protein
MADAEQVVRRQLACSIHARIERAQGLQPVIRKRQPQERSRQAAQQVPEGDIGLAHRHCMLSTPV